MGLSTFAIIIFLYFFAPSTCVSWDLDAETEALQEADRVLHIPGQPSGELSTIFSYVTADENYGKALFYCFLRLPINPQRNPFLLWLNEDLDVLPLDLARRKSLDLFLVTFSFEKDSVVKFNNYTWKKRSDLRYLIRASNLLFLDAPAGVGFSYSNKTLDVYGDNITATDSYAFLVNWFKRFPQYKSNEFYIAGESYAGHYVPQLAEIIYDWNQKTTTKENYINLKGFMEIRSENRLRWKFKVRPRISSLDHFWILCAKYRQVDPCSQTHATDYFNRQDVQEALHANVTKISKAWELCDIDINVKWNDSSFSILPIIKNSLMVVSVSGCSDLDFCFACFAWVLVRYRWRVPVTSTRYSLKKLGLNITEDWSPWYNHREVGGWTTIYEGLTFVTVRGAGHQVPTFAPKRSLQLVKHF
ncbi:hypothetical protein GIB67_003465 [Kingdonia uniflora]|uniref:Carboxypeptidase n=1 Tax=Kingdonia uniflora TaxID=39325 RepID=A0A7J7MEF4_9MAGN|nr:hypothetical protein GIB67_003465 [Kingdonia uniflora]